jgi:ribosome-binding protein aMBF1 (putative translation factor)
MRRASSQHAQIASSLNRRIVVGVSTKPNHDRLYKAVPSYLRSIREAQGLTQRDLAAKLKKQQYFVARCETGSRRVDVGEFVAWCLACKVVPKDGLDALTGRP